MQINEEPLEALPATLNLDQRWRNTLTSMNIRKNEQSIYRVTHFQAAISIHSAVKAFFFRDDLRIKVAKHRDKMAVLNAQRLKFEEGRMEKQAESFHSEFFSDSFADEQGEDAASDDLGQRFVENISDSSGLLSSQHRSSLVAEHEADAELRWFEQVYGRDELRSERHAVSGPSSRLTSTREIDEDEAREKEA